MTNTVYNIIIIQKVAKIYHNITIFLQNIAIMSYYEPIRDVQNKLSVVQYRNICARSHFHRSIELIFMEGGSASVRVGTAEQIFTAGDIAFVPSYFPHAVDSIKDAVFTTVIVPLHYAKEVSEGGASLHYFALRDKQFNKKIFDYLDECKAYLSAEANYMKKALITLIFGLIAEHYQQIEQSATEVERISNVIEFLDNHFTEPLTLESVATSLGFSRCYFSHLFHRYFNCNFNTYVNQLRMDFIKSQKNTDKNMTDVIIEAGFGSLSAYYQFKKKTK